MRSPFDDDAAAREVLEALRWPDGPCCPRCGARGRDVFRIGGKKHSHRGGLYQCKPCRRQFSVTVGTALERLRIPLSTWVRAAHAFSYAGPKYGNKGGKPPLTQLKRKSAYPTGPCCACATSLNTQPLQIPGVQERVRRVAT